MARATSASASAREAAGDHVAAEVDDRRGGEGTEQVGVEPVELADEQELPAGRGERSQIGPRRRRSGERLGGGGRLAEHQRRLRLGGRRPVGIRFLLAHEPAGRLGQVGGAGPVARHQPHGGGVDARVGAAEASVDGLVPLGRLPGPRPAPLTADGQRPVLGQPGAEGGDVLLERGRSTGDGGLEVGGGEHGCGPVGRPRPGQRQHGEVAHLDVVRVVLDGRGGLVEGQQVLAPGHGRPDAGEVRRRGAGHAHQSRRARVRKIRTQRAETCRTVPDPARRRRRTVTRPAPVRPPVGAPDHRCSSDPGGGRNRWPCRIGTRSCCDSRCGR